jgi:serine protease Do
VRGDKVYVVGNPIGILYSSVTDGIVSSMQRNYAEHIDMGNETNVPTMQVSAGITGGNSGGAVFNDKGQSMGVVIRGYRNTAASFAVPLGEITKFLTELKQEQVLAHCNK